MSWLARIEEACAAFIERAFANMFPSDLEPAQIARKLVAVMEARTQQNESTMVAPSRYVVSIHADDYLRLEPHKDFLEREWAALLRDVASRVGIRFVSASGSPAVELRPARDAVPGAIDIDVYSLPDAQEYVLRGIGGVPAETAYRIRGVMRLGRAKESDVFIVDPSVSRNHATLEVRDGKLIVRDAGSTNGTFVNGRRVEQHVLEPGDTVAFGKALLRVEGAI